MFGLLGRLVGRTWPILLVGWIALLVVSRWAAPPLDEVAQDKEFAFLPPDSPSRRGEAMFQKAFPDEEFASNVVLVFRRGGDNPASLSAVKLFIEDVVEPELRRIADEEGGLGNDEANADEPLFSENPDVSHEARPRSIIARIRTPNAPAIGALLVSPDRRVLIVILELTTEFLSRKNWPTVTKTEELIERLTKEGKIPPGVEVAITGSAVIGRDHGLAQTQSIQDTELLTVLLVVGLLIVIYRAPLLAMIPLATVYLAVQISLNLLAILGGAGYLNIFQGIQIYITILAYGTGVDYCLFLTARYKEELDRGKSSAESVVGSIAVVGGALTASAVTVICGIGMMVFAQFGKFRGAGFAIPIALCLVLAATLTFSPALLRLAGPWAFWPQRQKRIFTASASNGNRKRFFRGDWLQLGWEAAGQLLLRKPGAIWMATVGVMAPFAIAAGLLYNHLSYNLIGSLPADAPSVLGTRVLQDHFPAGLIGPTKVLMVNPRVDFSAPEGREFLARVTDRLLEKSTELGLADLRALTVPLGITVAAKEAFAGSDLGEEEQRMVLDRSALAHYVTDLGERKKIGARLDLVLNHSPFSRGSVAELDHVERAIRDSIPPEFRDRTEFYFAGPTASVRDLQIVIKEDRTRIEILVLASVFAVLVVLLRELFVPLYLLLSVLFSYYVTLGVSFAVFWLLDPHGFPGIDWKVPIFLFTILIAVGEDYNIFLMSRVREEQLRLGLVRGITEALFRTGPIISSCGIIMAGTFASLLSGTLVEMKQLGFALAFGVLLDTFVVRPILVPAFLILYHEGRLSRLTRKPKNSR